MHRTIPALIVAVVLAAALGLALAGCGEKEEASGTKVAASETRDSRTPNEKLCAAAETGDLEGVREALDAGADVNTKGEYDMTPLHWAAWNSYIDVATLLIDKGAVVDALDSTGNTPLNEAAKNEGNAEMVDLLLNRGANIETRQINGDTPLISAAGSGNLKAAGRLLDRGANMYGRDDMDQTPLHRAGGNGKNDMVTLLLDRGADVNVGSPAVADFRPIHCAALTGQISTVGLLIDRGAEVNPRNSAGETPLDMAQENGETETVEYLRTRGGVE